ncbi:MAG: hypothetical protein WCK02_16830 [Bacteroidota bacterium]
MRTNLFYSAKLNNNSDCFAYKIKKNIVIDDLELKSCSLPVNVNIKYKNSFNNTFKEVTTLKSNVKSSDFITTNSVLDVFTVGVIFVYVILFVYIRLSIYKANKCLYFN